MDLYAALLIMVSWLFAAWSSLAVLRAPVRFLWKPAVAATEWGHWLALFALGAVLAGVLSEGISGVVIPASLAALLFASPSLRAIVRTRALPAQLDRVLGEPTDGGFARRNPLVISDLGHIPLPEVDRSSFVYRKIDGLGLSLDLYRPRNQRRDLPVVVAVHGGSWNSGDSAQLSGMNRYLSGCGYAVAAINYRLAPRFRFPAQLDDIWSSISFLEARADEFGVDPGRIVLFGRSSGGHLALLAAYAQKSRSIRGVVALYPPTDMVWSWARPTPRRMMDSNAAIADFLGGTASELPETFELASPIQRVRHDSPPTLLIHGGKDELVSPLQSRRLATELDRVGVPHFHLELPWGNHGMDANLAGPSGQMTLYTIERFLRFATVRKRRIDTSD